MQQRSPVFDGHDVHGSLPSLILYVPRAQSTHIPPGAMVFPIEHPVHMKNHFVPGFENVADGHVSQSESEMPPWVGRYVSAGNLTHSVGTSLGPLYLPSRHAAHAEAAVAALNLPGAHLTHSEVPGMLL